MNLRKKQLKIFILFILIHPINALLPGLYCGERICYDGNVHFLIINFRILIVSVLVLNLTRNATKSEISKAYRKLAGKLHPDRQRTAEAKAKAEEQFREVAVAYETLKDEESRKNYDYMLDNPEEVYRHYWYYYRHRVTPKVDVRIVILGIILLISIIQYVSSWHKYEDAVKYMSTQAKYRLRAKEIAKERGFLSDIPKTGKKRKDKEELRQEEEAIIIAVIREFADIRGGYEKPNLSATLAGSIILLPVYIYRWLRFHVRWFWKFTIQKQEYGTEEKLHLIRKYMNMSQAQFDCINDNEKNDYLYKELWIKEKFSVWKQKKDAEEKQKMAESGQYKRMRRYLKKGMQLISTIRRRAYHTIVNSSWLAQKLANSNEKNLRILHASREGCGDYAEKHIPKSVCFDLKRSQNKNSPYNFMLPESDFFSNPFTIKVIDFLIKAFFVSDDHLVVYDSGTSAPSLELAARVWFTFRYFGHKSVSVLNGGLFNWMKEQNPITKDQPEVEKRNYTCREQRSLVVTYEEILNNLDEEDQQIIDCRAPNLFRGDTTMSSTRGKRKFEFPNHHHFLTGISGHIPGAINVPLTRLVDPDSRLILDKDKLISIFENAGVDLHKSVICSCNSGIQACGILLILSTLGKKDIKLYDGIIIDFNQPILRSAVLIVLGSWTEWSQRADPENVEVD
ncbi:DnaJ domain protein [Trichinella nativa]|uniref:DnaJ domain protein n=1 Tax=Trichinella nativa TaxID=6335 RepID=A0A1Y3EA64_9BILA|nr:DnaJ domain protein [Trichinella nativa]